MIHLVVIAVIGAAFLALAISMKRHQRDLLGRSLREGEASFARVTGWLLLALAWALDALALGPAIGTIVWTGEASVGAWLVVSAVTWRSS